MYIETIEKNDKNLIIPYWHINNFVPLNLVSIAASHFTGSFAIAWWFMYENDFSKNADSE